MGWGNFLVVGPRYTIGKEFIEENLSGTSAEECGLRITDNGCTCP